MCKTAQYLDIFNISYRYNIRSLTYFLKKCINPGVFFLGAFLLLLQPATADSPFRVSGYQTAAGRDGGLHTITPTRQKIDLSGTWNVTVQGDLTQEVEVPSAYDGTGEIVYERTFEVPPELLEDKSFTLVAYGINYSANVVVNGIEIGNHSGGATSFHFSVAREVLRAGENTVVITVNNHLRTRNTLPINAQMWSPKNYGGIYRDIYLLVQPETAIIDKNIHTTFLDGYSVAEMDIDFVVGKSGDLVHPDAELIDTDTYHIAVEIFDRQRGTVLVQSRRVPISFGDMPTVKETVRVIARNPRLWSPDQPDLYTVSMVLYRDGAEYDRKNIIYGFREIVIRDGSIYINDEIFRARGVLYHEYHPERGSALSYEDLERDVALMKVANINFVRVAFRPPHPYLLNLFDRYGMLCMIEIPAINIPGNILRNESLRSTAQKYLIEMIERDRHHPSVFAWGIGHNLEMPHPGTVDYVREMRDYVQQIDNRPVYACSQFPSNDAATEHLDLAVLNFPPGLNHRVARSVEAWKERFPDKPLIVGKLGYYVEPGNTGGYRNRSSYEAQARYLMQMMQLLRGYDVDGILVNSFTDWRAERPSMTGFTGDLTLHTSGILSADRQQRRGFEVVRSLYRGEAAPAFIAGEEPGATPFEYIVGGFVVLIGFAHLLNYSRRFREHVNRSLIRPYNFYADVRDRRILSGFHTLYLGLLISLTMAMIFASFLQHYKYNQIIDYIFTHFLITDSVKAFLANTLHETWQLILLLAMLYFIMLLFTTLVVQIISLFGKTKVYLSHSFIVTFWSALPLVIFIPLAMILYSVLETEFYVVPILILIGIILLWVFLRLLKGVSIIYDTRRIRVYVFGFLILIFINGIMLLIGEYLHSTLSYVSFFVHMFEGFRF